MATLEKCEKAKVSKKGYKNNKKLKLIEDSVIRKFCMFLYKKFNLKDVQESTFYRHVHDTFIFLVSFISLFSVNLTHLVIIFIIVINLYLFFERLKSGFILFHFFRLVEIS